jgi:sugar phosphate isomerase/epimerase
MIRLPFGLRLNPTQPIREQMIEAARLGAKGVVLDAINELSPDRLSETGRREIRYLLRSVELSLIALHLPTRRPFDTLDQLDHRLRRADRAFALAYELGTTLVLARVGALPPESESQSEGDAGSDRRGIFLSALGELGRRADHRGVRLAIETGTEPGNVLAAVLEALNSTGLAASTDPAALLQNGIDPIATTRSLGHWVAHAYASDPATNTSASGFATLSRSGVLAGALDWEEYLGALEEIGYHRFLTVWPDLNRPAAPQFKAIVERLGRY